MSHPKKKKQRTTVGDVNVTEEAGVADDHQMAVSVEDLSIDVLANIFAFLSGAKDIMQKRRVCKKWKEAVKKTIVPLTEFSLDNMKTYNAMNLMTRALPNLQQLNLCSLGWGHKWKYGEDPDKERTAETADYTDIAHDIGIISHFSKLRILDIDAPLNGRYPFLFSSFPLLQKLRINSDYLKWDLEMLAGFPLLDELNCESNIFMTGNITSLGALKDTLVKVKIYDCPGVEGNFMDLVDFPHLKELDLYETAVTGDIQDIGENDFTTLEKLDLPKGVYGGAGYELQRISDAPGVVRAVYLLIKQRPALRMMEDYWYVVLSEDSPDWYDSTQDDDSPPFYIHFVKAGSRIGYRWETRDDKPCEVNWLDPEPERGSIGYEDYVADYRSIQRKNSRYRGYYEPPTEEQYNLLYEEYLAEIQSDDEDY